MSLIRSIFLALAFIVPATHVALAEEAPAPAEGEKAEKKAKKSKKKAEGEKKEEAAPAK